MMDSTYLDPLIETLGRDALSQIQLKKFQLMLDPVLKSNSFYRRIFEESGINRPEDIQTLEDLKKLPLTNKFDLTRDQINHPPYGSNLTFSRDKYIRMHHTSGTTGEQMRCLDTQESWDWWARCWSTVYKAVGVTSLDRIFFAFSFGPYIGFWSAHEGARHIGALAIPGGGMSSYQRVKAIMVNDISVLVCTPTYALHLAEIAEQENIDIANSNVRITIHAGEPGASIPSTKNRIETAWGARCYDHAGATEVGAWGFECLAQSGLHVNEGEFIIEIIDPSTDKPSDEGELIITNLGRTGMPVIRYRTGDRVKLAKGNCECGRTFQRFEGGIIGRADDALIIRGVNVFPSAIENIVRDFPEISEFAVDVYRKRELDIMEIRIEVKGVEPETITSALEKEIHNSLGLRVSVRPVPFGTLPRFDLKARRFIDHRHINPND